MSICVGVVRLQYQGDRLEAALHELALEKARRMKAENEVCITDEHRVSCLQAARIRTDMEELEERQAGVEHDKQGARICRCRSKVDSMCAVQCKMFEEFKADILRKIEDTKAAHQKKKVATAHCSCSR